ncbi:TonB-dependent receptor [Carboxylicivirga sp. M1479]|uniref:TonB-dependent receptor n=1 Tax=Carboxylicivirga sp. M1479 TaxID=2594476 RepID=UPI0011778AE7|nr:TonB-dependent receptor [Carboxylicivirga sp. M1479]TRX66370.1 TonB-dependent receptor [Carboxylicivirga sp. M1479]
MYSKFFLIFLFSLFASSTVSQECNHLITGVVRDAQTGEEIPYASVLISEYSKGAVTNDAGIFVISHVCDTSFTLTVSFLGYEVYENLVSVSNDQSIVVELIADSKKINDVTVTAGWLSATERLSQRIGDEQIQYDVNESLANMLESLSGVSSLKSGGGIAKPVVQGLYGNRLPILNNGVAQSGQQWGNDHSPEIDPIVANTISVISGVHAMEYQGRSLGNMVLVEAKPIRRHHLLSGKAGYFFESNGRGNGVNLALQKYDPTLAWKVNGTLKKRGDQHAADYYLTNTGIEEANVALQLEKVINDRWSLDAMLSSFNTQIGVLRGSHIGNLTDLEEALERDVPFYTNDYFSYDINAPRQTVAHHLVKLQAKYFKDDHTWVNIVYATQLNNRKEYDVKRLGRSEVPSLSLQQFTHFIEAKYSRPVFNAWRLKTGLQFNFIDNSNDPETGILPLIPDYYSYEMGSFATFSKHIKRWYLQIGGRYDYQMQNVAAISNSIPREIIRYNNHFHSYKIGIDSRYFTSSTTEIIGSLGIASRNPEVNEFYSNGLHQGVGGIEEGDPDLVKESAIKGSISINSAISSKLQIESSVYSQYIEDYIYLQPQDEIRLTIRGAFPVFKYEQANASIIGADIMAHYHISENIKFSGQYSYLRGNNLSDDVPLINMPSNSFSTSLRYTKEKIVFIDKLSLDISQRYVYQQSHLLPEQDFTEPPEAYNLLGFQLTAQNQIKQMKVNSFIRVDNLLNVSYRDYLNRMRYFADDLGMNVVIGLNLSF